MSVAHDLPGVQDTGAWPEFLTVEEVAVICRVSKMTVYRMIHRGDLRAKRVGRSFRVFSVSLEEYLAVPAVPA